MEKTTDKKAATKKADKGITPKAEAVNVEKVAEPKKGVVGWQKALRTLRDLVNLAQLNAESIADATIAQRLSVLAKDARITAEKSETIPARLNRRYLKYCGTK